VVPTGTVTAVVEVEATPTATVTIPPAATPTIAPSRTPTIIPSQTPTIAPSQTPRPTVTAEPTVTATPYYYDMPAWVSDPAVNVLLLRTDSHATLFNAETGERFDIPIGEGSPSVSWIEREDGLYVHVGYSAAWDATSWLVEESHTVTGQFKRFEVPRQLTPGVPSTPSPDGSYEVRIIQSEGVPAAVYLMERESGEETELVHPSDGQYERVADVEWSPDGQMVAIERFYVIDDPTANYGRRSISALVVYTADGNRIGEHLDSIGSDLEWSPTSPYRILHPRHDLKDNPPCIWDVVTDSYNCLDQLVAWREEQGVETFNYHWSPDGDKVGFIAWSHASDAGGFCYVDLPTGEIICPVTVKDLRADEILIQFEPMCNSPVLYIVDYYWSPDLSYVALEIDLASPSSDFNGCNAVAVVDGGSGDFQLVVEGMMDFHDPWRPVMVGGSD
jgi:WD40 repeat protein